MTEAADKSEGESKPSKSEEEKRAQRMRNLEKAREAKKRKAEERKRAAAAEKADKKDAEPDTEEVDGQKLVRVNARKGNGAASKFESLDDVLQARPAPRDDAEGNGAPRRRTEKAARAAASEPDSYPTVEEIARRTSAKSSHSMADPVPPAEWQPERRDLPSMEPVGDLRTKHTPRTLMDLMALVPSWSSGQYYVAVDRKKPTSWGGLDIGGLQAPIREYLDDNDFTQRYGGGKYELILYGPPPSGGEIDYSTGKRRYRALTDPVKWTVPMAGHPPQLTSEEFDDEDEDDMQTFRRPAIGGSRGRPATNADARMFETQLQHEERADERRRREWKEREEERKEAEREAKNRDISIFELMEERRAREAERWREDFHEREQMLRQQHEREMRMLRDELKKNAERPTPTAELGDTMAKLMGALKTDGTPKEDVARIEKAASEDRERMTRQHQEEVQRITAQYEERIKDIAERGDKRIREAEERASARVKEVEERSDRRIKEIEDAARQRVEDVRNQAQRDQQQAETNSNNRIQDLVRQHERDLRAKDESYQMQLQAQKNTFESRIHMLEQEVNRERSEKDRLRTELEQAKDLPSQLSRFKETAAAIGMSEGGDDGPKDWKGMLLQLGTQLPDMIRSAGDTVMQMRGQPGQPQQQMTPEQQAYLQQQAYERMQQQGQQAPQGAAGYVAQEQPLAFGTEDGPDFDHGEDTAPPPAPRESHEGPPAVAPGPHAPQAEAQQQEQQPPPPQPSAAPPQQQSAAMVHQPNAPQQPPPQQQQRPAAPVAGAVPVSDDQIMQYHPAFEEALADGVEPDEFAEHLISSLGPQMARTLYVSIKPDRVLQLIQARGVQSALVRRAGQQWLRAVWQSVGKRIGMG